jgi:hypothetical protein
MNVVASQEQQISVKGEIYNLKSLLHFIDYDQFHADGIAFNGDYDKNKNNLHIKAKALGFRSDQLSSDTIDFNAFIAKDELLVQTDLSVLKNQDSLFVRKAHIHANLGNDSIKVETRIFGKKETDIIALNNLIDFKDEKTLTFLESQFRLGNAYYRIQQDGKISFNDKTIAIDGLSVNQAQQSLALHGNISKNANDSLLVDLKDIDLDQFNEWLKDADTRFEGYLNSHLNIKNLYSNPMVTGNLDVEDFVLDGEKLGDLAIKSDYDDQSKHVNLLVNIIRESDTVAKVDGFVGVTGEEHDILLNIDLNKSSIRPLEKILKPDFTDISGYANSKVVMYNTLERPLLKGYVDVDKARLRIDYLNTYVNCTGRVTLSEKAIEFNDLPFTDDGIGVGKLMGEITHDYFRNNHTNLKLEVENFQVMNTKYKNGSTYYGRGIASGTAAFNGHVSSIAIDIKAKTRKGTVINIPYGEQSVSQGDQYVIFVNSDEVIVKDSTQERVLADTTGFDINIDLAVTPDAEVRMILDPVAGDQISGKGNSNLNIRYSRAGEFTMNGEYIFTEGDYKFTFQNFIDKRFKIQDGSSIKWNYDPLHAQLKVTAIYGTKTYVKNLLNSENLTGVKIDSSQFNRRFNVDTYLRMTGDLQKPDINFEIKVQGINENDISNPVTAQLRYINNNQDELNRQIFGIFVFGGFLSDNAFSSQGGVTTGINSASELISNQLSNFLSKYAGNVNVGINYRDLSSSTTTSSTRRELQVALNTTAFNNRMIIDGALDIGNDQIAATNRQAVGGDFQIEYKVTEDGQFRVKGFNKIDDRVFINKDSNYRQGMGISLRRDYDTPYDIVKDPVERVVNFWDDVLSWMSKNRKDAP